jgi:hypothetical protein
MSRGHHHHLHQSKSMLKFKLNRGLILNTFLGLVIALIFDDVKELVINEIILKFVNTNIKTKEIEILGVKINLQKVIDLLVNILLSLFIIYILHISS